MQTTPEPTSSPDEVLASDLASDVVQVEAKSVREGLNEVRKALGADAIILAQEHFPNGVHIWATNDMAVAGQWQKAAEGNPETADKPDLAVPEALEIEPLPEPGETIGAQDVLSNNGIDSEINDEITAAGYAAHHGETYPTASSLTQLRTQMVRDLTVHETPGTLTGRLVFLGSAGAGKTTFLLKQLVASTEHQAAADIAVVNCDQHRLGGGETINLACQIFGVECFDVAPENLAEFLPGLGHKKLVLIDAPGNCLDVAENTALSRIWVVSALLHPRFVEQQWRGMREHAPNYVALTHADNVVDGDDLLRRLYQWRLPVIGINSSAEFAVDLANLDTQLVYESLFGYENNSASVAVSI